MIYLYRELTNHKQSSRVLWVGICCKAGWIWLQFYRLSIYSIKLSLLFHLGWTLYFKLERNKHVLRYRVSTFIRLPWAKTLHFFNNLGPSNMILSINRIISGNGIETIFSTQHSHKKKNEENTSNRPEYANVLRIRLQSLLDFPQPLDDFLAGRRSQEVK